jgi:DNA modification methylase
MNIPTKMITHDYIGIRDFRGDLIRHFETQGFIYYGEVCIWKNPQVQSIRTHTKCLTFKSFNKDSLNSRPALPDYILIFKKHGDNEVPVIPTENGLSNDKWIDYASPIWMDVRETHTLNSIKADKDEKHMCPLQLDVIERLIHLYSNKGETVLTPFMGVGSEVYMSLLNSRKAIGVELKPEYFDQACKNIEDAVFQKTQNENALFSF